MPSASSAVGTVRRPSHHSTPRANNCVTVPHASTAHNVPQASAATSEREASWYTAVSANNDAVAANCPAPWTLPSAVTPSASSRPGTSTLANTRRLVRAAAAGPALR